MAGNNFPVQLHSTFFKKVSNFPVDIYNFNDGYNLTTLMQILLGNSGTGQLRNIQTAARITQEILEFSDLDQILGTLLNVSRVSSEVYSFPTNPFIDQLTSSQWQEIITKDASYRERLLGAAESYQLGPNLWGLLTLCEALTQTKFYAVESWRTPGYGRTGLNPAREIVFIPLLDSATASGFFSFNQYQKQTILNTMQNLLPMNYQVSFGSPIQTFTQVSGSYTTASGYSESYYLQPTVTTSTVNSPSNIQLGSATRYWIKNNNQNVAPNFAHLQTEETSIDLTGNIISVTSTSDTTGNLVFSVAPPSITVTSTIYGGQ